MSTADRRFTVYTYWDDMLVGWDRSTGQTTMQDLTQRGHGVTVVHLADAQFIQA